MPGTGMDRCIEKLCRLSVFDAAPRLHDQHLIGQLLYRAKVVRDEDQGSIAGHVGKAAQHLS